MWVLLNVTYSGNGLANAGGEDQKSSGLHVANVFKGCKWNDVTGKMFW